MNTEEDWLPINTAPTDDDEFLVGGWHGRRRWDADTSKWVWVTIDGWWQVISHHENPNSPRFTRGWNHRNGPSGPNGLRPTHWRKLPKPPRRKPLTEKQMAYFQEIINKSKYPEKS